MAESGVQLLRRLALSGRLTEHDVQGPALAALVDAGFAVSNRGLVGPTRRGAREAAALRHAPLSQLDLTSDEVQALRNAAQETSLWKMGWRHAGPHGERHPHPSLKFLCLVDDRGQVSARGQDMLRLIDDGVDVLDSLDRMEEL